MWACACTVLKGTKFGACTYTYYMHYALVKLASVLYFERFSMRIMYLSDAERIQTSFSARGCDLNIWLHMLTCFQRSHGVVPSSSKTTEFSRGFYLNVRAELNARDSQVVRGATLRGVDQSCSNISAFNESISVYRSSFKHLALFVTWSLENLLKL